VVGEISDSFSMLLQSVSRGSMGSRCASSSETTAETGFVNDCPSWTRMLLERGQETQPTSRPQPSSTAAAARPAQTGRLSTCTSQYRALPALLWRALGDAM
jgi:hypothetical protein